jgi:thiol-disulfide isomerase/thioredoxin
LTLKTRLVVATLLIVVTFAPSWGIAAHKLRPGDLVTDFAFNDFSGEPHRLSDYSGHYVLLDFWATWCVPCLKEVPVLKKAIELYQVRGLRILGMNSDEKVDEARKFLEERKVSWPQSSPESTKRIVKSELGVKWYPAMILLDPQRRIVLVSGNGKSVLKGGKLLDKLNKILPPARQP